MMLEPYDQREAEAADDDLRQRRADEADEAFNERRQMKKLSLEPDAHMRWIYDQLHRDYNSDRAKDLRARRAAALSQCPQYMLEEAWLNDQERRRRPADDLTNNESRGE